MLSVTTLGIADSAALFIQAHDCPVGSALQQLLPAWVWACEDAPVEVFIQWGDRVLYCPLADLLSLAKE